MTKSFEIYFSDLSPETQKRYLKFQGVSSAEDLNADILPLAIIEVEEE